MACFISFRVWWYTLTCPFSKCADALDVLALYLLNFPLCMLKKTLKLLSAAVHVILCLCQYVICPASRDLSMLGKAVLDDHIHGASDILV